ncbi:MAG: iron ABC transporter permease [Alphaproteobacteria bacterium]|nr:iron ABC transporter permease [Alphaproteobacteria bacterium]
MSQRLEPSGRSPRRGLALALFLLGGLAVCAGLGVGAQGWTWPWTPGAAVPAEVWLELRLPRSAGAWLTGALLGLAGALGQALFRNPLADPYLLGSASGAGLGVAVGLVLAHGLTPSLVSPLWPWLPWGQGLLAFAGAWLSLMLALLWSGGLAHTPRLLLAGVVVGVILSALTSTLMLWVPQAWVGFQSFMLGTTQMLDLTSLAVLAAGLCVVLCLVVLDGPALDVLSLGEDTARSMGLPLARTRARLIVAMTLATSLAVSHTGLMAFVGLAAPHLARSLVRPPPSALPCWSLLTGGLLLVLADGLSRWWWSPLEWPVGVVTALIGGLYLLYRLGRESGGQS